MRLILASSSLYRQEMLQRLCIPFESIAPNINETPLPNERPAVLALRLARQKAQAVAHLYGNAIIIGSDQVATFNDIPIGKPGSHDQALEQLQTLSGKTVKFHTALCVMRGDEAITEDIVTICQFRSLSKAEILYYLEQEKPYDTAGSAKAESLGIALMERISADDPTAIIGLPLIALSRMLRHFNLNPLTPFTP